MWISNNKLFLIGLLICIINVLSATETNNNNDQNDVNIVLFKVRKDLLEDPTSTSTSTTTTTTTTSTSTTTTSTTTTTTTTSSTSTTTTTPTTTTTTATSTTTTTAQSSTTTAKPDEPKIFNYTIPQNTSLPTCLKARFSVSFNISYLAISDRKTYNSSVVVDLDSVQNYDGQCSDSYNTLSVMFVPNRAWLLSFNYTLNKNQYVLNTLKLDYVVDQTVFPNAADQGKKQVGLSGLNLFSANKDNSYKCWSKTDVTLDEVRVEFRNYQAEPFLGGKKDFDTAVECPADQSGTSELVPIIVGTALAVLVIFVLIAYIVGRRKHRPGYQQV